MLYRFTTTLQNIFFMKLHYHFNFVYFNFYLKQITLMTTKILYLHTHIFYTRNIRFCIAPPKVFVCRWLHPICVATYFCHVGAFRSRGRLCTHSCPDFHDNAEQIPAAVAKIKFIPVVYLISAAARKGNYFFLFFCRWKGLYSAYANDGCTIEVVK